MEESTLNNSALKELKHKGLIEQLHFFKNKTRRPYHTETIVRMLFLIDQTDFVIIDDDATTKMQEHFSAVRVALRVMSVIA